MVVHDVLARRLAGHQQRVDQLAAAEAASQERVRAAMMPYQRALAEWNASSRRAVLEGRDPEPRPAVPDLGADQDAARMFEARREELARERQALLATVAEDVEHDAAQREGELLAEAREALAQLEPIVDELGDLLRATREVRAARGGPDHVQRTRSGVDVHDLVDAVRGEASLLELAAPQRRQTVGPEPPPVPPYTDRYRVGRGAGRVA